MAFGHGKKGRVLLGKYDLSPFLSSFGGNLSNELADVTTLTKNSKCVVMGQGDGKVSFGGYFDGAAAAIDAILREFDSGEVAWPFMVAPAGYGSIGSRALIGQGMLETYEVTGDNSGAVEVSGEVQSSEAADLGVILADLAARTANGNGSSIDNAAASANGGVAVLHASAYATLTNAIVKVQHSTDDSAWVDLVTFTTLTAAGYQFSEVAAGTTVNRYLRALWTVTGSGSFTAAVGFARR